MAKTHVFTISPTYKANEVQKRAPAPRLHSHHHTTGQYFKVINEEKISMSSPKRNNHRIWIRRCCRSTRIQCCRGCCRLLTWLTVINCGPPCTLPASETTARHPTIGIIERMAAEALQRYDKCEALRNWTLCLFRVLFVNDSRTIDTVLAVISSKQSVWLNIWYFIIPYIRWSCGEWRPTKTRWTYED